MEDPPEITIVRGSPTPEEEAAVRAAILKLWREERAEAAREAGASRWVRSARAGGGIVRTRAPGRGDAK